jgi:RimJ/RimL family protein N-acetyltransferase
MTTLPIGPKASMPICANPSKQDHIGHSVSLVPLNPCHVPELWQAAQGADESWTYLGYGPFRSYEEFERHVISLAEMIDQPFFAVIPFQGKACGWISFCDAEPSSAAIEIGSIWFSPVLQRTRAATEAIFLMLNHAFAIGFNRVAWRCNALNAPSRKAAERLGFSFEGTWRQAQIVKERWRDTSWYSQLAEEWPANKLAFERWLRDTNFDKSGQQLSALRGSPAASVTNC